MHDSAGTEVEAVARWLEGRSASGAAAVLRRVARQRDRARNYADHADEQMLRHRLAWRSARQRAHRGQAEAAKLRKRLADTDRLLSGEAKFSSKPAQDILRQNAEMRVDLARFQTVFERVGWISDPESRRLWRWRDGWWELVHRKRNREEGYLGTGWYLWGSAVGCRGEWAAAQKTDAMTEADRMISGYLAVIADTRNSDHGSTN